MYPIITTVTLITKSWSRRRLLAPVGPAPVQAGIDSVLFITQWRQRSPVLRRAAPDEVELPSRVTGYTATADATKHVGYQHNNESSVVYRDSTCFLQPGSVARLRDTGLPTRTRSRWHRRSGRRWHTRTVARRLRDPQLAGRLRHLSGCRRGRTWFCFASLDATQKMTLTDGTELAPALGIGAFAEKTLVAAGQRPSSNVGCTSSSTSPHSEVMCRSTAEIGQRLAELRARSSAQFPRGWERIWERNAAPRPRWRGT